MRYYTTSSLERIWHTYCLRTLSFYDRRSGLGARTLQGGAVQTGLLINSALTGWATCTWPHTATTSTKNKTSASSSASVSDDVSVDSADVSGDVSVYMGQWQSGLRYVVVLLELHHCSVDIA
jgi:hypothetical protein